LVLKRYIYYIAITMQNSSNIVTTIYKSRETILEQLKNLGYNVEDYTNFSRSEINTKFATNQLDMLLEKKKEDPITGKKQKVYILYYLAKLIRPNNIQDILDDLYVTEEVLTKDDTLLIISKEEVNETLSNYLKHIWETEETFVVIQNIKRLQFNIQKHVMVPVHTIMTADEIDNIRKKYNINANNQFPEISRFDPVAQTIYMRPGQVCKIERPSKTAITALYYRICV